MKNNNKLKDKITLITGSGRGLGASIAKRFAHEGAKVIVNDLNSENAKNISDEINKLYPDSSSYSLHDVSDSKQNTELFTEIEKKFGKLDVIVNNAGITRDAMLHKMTEMQFDDVIKVNLKGVFLCSQSAAKLMAPNNSGRIINLASIAALGNIGQSNYSASKAGVIGLTKTLALELARYRVTANAIAPGFFDTNMTQVISAEIREKFIQQIPLKRMGSPEEIASLALFIASDEASYITGQTFFIDGGLSIGAS